MLHFGDGNGDKKAERKHSFITDASELLAVVFCLPVI
jgi:hypothetical protein